MKKLSFIVMAVLLGSCSESVLTPDDPTKGPDAPMQEEVEDSLTLDDLSFIPTVTWNQDVPVVEEEIIPEKLRITDEVFANHIAGKGWRFQQSYSIEEDGQLKNRGYMYGSSPADFYFEKDVMFIMIDTNYDTENGFPMRSLIDCGYTVEKDPETGVVNLTYGPEKTQIQLVSLNLNEDASTLEVIAYAGVTGDQKPVYTYNLYRQMTTEELQSSRKLYGF